MFLLYIFIYIYIYIHISLCVCVCPASISSFLTVLAWYPNTSLRTWCLVLHSLTLMTNMPACGQYSTLTDFLLCVINTQLRTQSDYPEEIVSFLCVCFMKELSHYLHSDWLIRQGLISVNECEIKCWTTLKMADEF